MVIDRRRLSLYLLVAHLAASWSWVLQHPVSSRDFGRHLSMTTPSSAQEPSAVEQAVSSTNKHDQNIAPAPPPHLAFMGGGIFFYWQAGVITYLREQGYDLSATSSTGASAGALCATLTACDVDFYHATDLALSMAKDAGVWDRRGGLQGIWGPMIREWLDRLLPDDAVAYTTARETSLLVTRLPYVLQKQRIASFTDRQDLIDCNMASVHLPYFLDGQLTTTFRTRPCIDGSFCSRPADYEPIAMNNDRSSTGSGSGRDSKLVVPTTQRETLFLSHQHDPVYNEQSMLEFVRALSPDRIYGMMEDGKRYARLMEERGQFANIPFIKPSKQQQTTQRVIVGSNHTVA